MPKSERKEPESVSRQEIDEFLIRMGYKPSGDKIFASLSKKDLSDFKSKEAQKKEDSAWFNQRLEKSIKSREGYFEKLRKDQMDESDSDESESSHYTDEMNQRLDVINDRVIWETEVVKVIDGAVTTNGRTSSQVKFKEGLVVKKRYHSNGEVEIIVEGITVETVNIKHPGRNRTKEVKIKDHIRTIKLEGHKVYLDGVNIFTPSNVDPPESIRRRHHTDGTVSLFLGNKLVGRSKNPAEEAKHLEMAKKLMLQRLNAGTISAAHASKRPTVPRGGFRPGIARGGYQPGMEQMEYHTVSSPMKNQMTKGRRSRGRGRKRAVRKYRINAPKRGRPRKRSGRSKRRYEGGDRYDDPRYSDYGRPGVDPYWLPSRSTRPRGMIKKRYLFPDQEWANVAPGPRFPEGFDNTGCPAGRNPFMRNGCRNEIPQVRRIMKRTTTHGPSQPFAPQGPSRSFAGQGLEKGLLLDWFNFSETPSPTSGGQAYQNQSYFKKEEIYTPKESSVGTPYYFERHGLFVPQIRPTM